MRLSNSKVRTWRRCPKKFYYKYEMGLRTKTKSIQLERGSWIHELLQYHYDGEDWLARHKELTVEFYKLFEEEREDLGDLPAECLTIMKNYLREYATEDANYRVIDSELDEIVTLPNGLRIQIIVDLILEEKRSGALWIVDHKTRKNFSDDTSMILDPQLTVYYWGLGILGYKKLNGVMYNEIRTKLPTAPEPLKSGELSRAKSIDTDVYTYMRAIKRAKLNPADYSETLALIAQRQHQRFFRRTFIPKDIPMTKQTIREFAMAAEEIEEAQAKTRFPRTFIQNSCAWDCEYRDVCLTEYMGGDIDPLIKMNFEVKDGN